jgi:Aldo/keto reductase family
VVDQGEDDALVSVLLEEVAGVREPQHLGIGDVFSQSCSSTFLREGDVLQRPRHADRLLAEDSVEYGGGCSRPGRPASIRLTNTPENVAFVREAVAAGIGLIDTAHVYTGRQSEQTIGAAVSSPDACLVGTKGGYGSGRPQGAESRDRREHSPAADEHTGDTADPRRLSLDRLRENLAALEIELSDADFDALK